ncbi:MAG: 5-(carboxyamino)imidazole ribonucleotide synthase [Halothiobacillaceae bacterium]
MRHIGILGGGQLGQMLALAGMPLGYRFTFLDPGHQPCAARLGHHLQAEYDDVAALKRLGIECDLVTFEFENVPAAAIALISQFTEVFPGKAALSATQDRLEEKLLLQRLGVPVTDFCRVDSLDDLQAGAARLGLPAVLKTRRFGYDGKGQRVLRKPADLREAFEQLGGTPLILEAWVPFNREVSLVVVRSRRGEIACYPLSENRHREGILHVSRARPGDWMQAQAEQHAARIVEALGHVGAMAIEFFQVDDRLLVNELAPRVHNSGHWTQDGAVTCQFENHLRAIDDLPLGNTHAFCHAAMLNLLGEMPNRRDLLAVPGTHLHDYQKAPRQGRKLGHVNITAPTAPLLEQRLAHAEALLSRPTAG